MTIDDLLNSKKIKFTIVEKAQDMELYKTEGQCGF